MARITVEDCIEKVGNRFEEKIGPSFLTEVVQETFDDELAMPGEAAGGE